MNRLARFVFALYSHLLSIYPRRFRAEFAEEMEAVFRESLSDALEDGILPFLVTCAKELGGLPLHIFREVWHELGGKETIMAGNKVNVAGSTSVPAMNRRDIILGVLPFVFFGVAMMLSKSNLTFHPLYVEITFIVIALLGLLVGLVMGFPQWTYSYLGWSMVMAWWWMTMPVFSLTDPTYYRTHTELIGWWSWTPLLITLGIGLLLKRSIRPFYNMIQGIWQDWTHLSFMIYTFVAFAQLIYDENHHPFLFAFMTGSTIVISAGAWMFLYSANHWRRIAALLSGFLAASVIGSICYATWDWAAYYGFPPSQPEPWTVSAMKYLAMFAFWSVILFWPAIIGLVQNTVRRRKPA